MHPSVAEVCIAERRHLVTTSYVSPEMAKLDEEAKKVNKIAHMCLFREKIMILNQSYIDKGWRHCAE